MKKAVFLSGVFFVSGLLEGLGQSEAARFRMRKICFVKNGMEKQEYLSQLNRARSMPGSRQVNLSWRIGRQSLKGIGALLFSLMLVAPWLILCMAAELCLCCLPCGKGWHAVLVLFCAAVVGAVYFGVFDLCFQKENVFEHILVAAVVLSLLFLHLSFSWVILEGLIIQLFFASLFGSNPPYFSRDTEPSGQECFGKPAGSDAVQRRRGLPGGMAAWAIPAAGAVLAAICSIQYEAAFLATFGLVLAGYFVFQT